MDCSSRARYALHCMRLHSRHRCMQAASAICRNHLFDRHPTLKLIQRRSNLRKTQVSTVIADCSIPASNRRNAGKQPTRATIGGCTGTMPSADLAQQGKLELVLDLNGELLEGPIWDERIKKLHFIDINGQHIHTFDPHEQSEVARHSEVKLPEKVGCIGLTEDPNILLAALHRRVVLFDLTKQTVVSEIASSPEEHGVEDYRFNDGKISPGGVFIGGRMHLSGAEIDGKHSHWYRLEWHKDQSKSRLVQLLGPDGVQLPNGLDWNDKKRVMYFNDSINNHNKPPSGTIWEYQTDELGIPIDTHHSSKHTRKVKTVGVNKEGGVPDGMCLDHEGRIWTALCGGGAVVCIDPEDGKELHRVSMPVSTPTACAFVGDEQKLYITTINDKSKGAGGLWSYHLPGLAGWSGAHIAKPQY